MARNDQLPTGNIVPAARPVESFIQPGRIDAAAPARPEPLRLSGDSIGLVNTPGRPSVPGSNPGAQLAEALSAFNVNLTKTLGSGVQLYASNEYRQGQNEAYRAYQLANRQMQASALEYAADNRAVAARDPIAGLAMDQANPFRVAGRQNRLSQIAGTEIGGAIEQAYRRQAVDLAQLDPSDPRINEVKAAEVTRIAQKYGLDEFSPGFADYVLPQVNRAWEKVTAKQIEDRNAYLKDTVWRTASTQLMANLRTWRNQNQPVEQQIAAMAMYLDDEARRMGIGGEATDMKRKAIEQARQVLLAGKETDLANMLLKVPVGPPDGNGIRATAGAAYALDIMEADDKYGEIERRRQARVEEAVGDEVSDRIAKISLEMDDGPEKAAAIEQVLNDEKYRDLSFAKKLELASQTNKLGEDIRGQQYDSDAFEQFMGKLDRTFGSQRDLKTADREFEALIPGLPQEERAAARKRYSQWRNQTQSQPWQLINPAITAKIKANLEREYPSLQTAALRGLGSIEQVMAWGDADSQRSAQRQLNAYRSHVLARLDEARTKSGAELSDRAAQAVINQAINEYGSKDKEAYQQLFPRTVTGGSGAKPEAKPAPPPGMKPATQLPVNPGQLDNMPNRQERLQSPEPVLSAKATSDLLLQALNGGALPAPLQRAARDAGVSPEQFLIRQADAYPRDIKLSPADRNKLLRRGNQSKGYEDNSQSRQPLSNAPLSAATNWLLDTLTGSRPAYAGEQNLISLRYSGGGGGSPAGDIGAFRAAIFGQESGGNYRAVNPHSGALGVGQVMPANVGPWTEKYLGRRLTPQQFLASNSAQDAVVNGRFRDMFEDQRRAGYTGEVAVRRAAAEWYSGDARLWNSNRPEYYNGHRYPSIAEYTKSIWDKYRRHGGSIAASSASASASSRRIVTGDSIASGIGHSSARGSATSDAQWGRGATAQLAWLKGKGAGYFRGADVVLSSGLLNEPSGAAKVEEQIKFLKASGARSIQLVGGPTSGSHSGVNATLKRLAEKHGVRFMGGYTPGSDGVHPSSYSSLRG